jgi:hypothetical protein
MRIPSLSRRSDPAPTNDLNGDGRTDGGDRTGATGTGDLPVGQQVATDRGEDQATYRSSAAATGGERVSNAERRAAERAATARAATARPVEGGTRGNPVVVEPATEQTVDGDRDRTVVTDRDDTDLDGRRREAEVPVVAGPRPRASLLATLGLIAGVAAALFVLTGTLAGYGIALGGIGAVLSVLGLIATRRRHIAGKTDALIGMLLGLGAVVLGVLAMTGQFDWPTTNGDWVQRLREWLDSQFVARF